MCVCVAVQLLSLEKDMQQSRREHQEAQGRSRQLEQKAEELEKRDLATLDNHQQQVKLMEVEAMEHTRTCAPSHTHRQTD